MSAARAALLRAAKELLAEDGYGATSPQDILRRSGAGQGVLYYHFRGKNGLVAAALQEVSAELCAETDELLASEAEPVAAVRAWLTAPREALKGCRLGRLTGEPIPDDAAVRRPLSAYFEYTQQRLAERLHAAGAAGRLDPGVNPDDLATAIVAVVQGGFVISLATRDPQAMNRAQRAAAALLDARTIGAS